MNDKKVYIYVLLCPISKEPKYIGKTNNCKTRLRNHLYEKANNKKNNWFQDLIRNGLKPLMVVLDIVSITEWEFWEKFYISFFQELGFDLKNTAPGGFGNRIMSDDTKQKVKQYRKGKTYEEIFGQEKAKILKQNISQKNRERIVKDTTRKKLSDNNSKYWKYHEYPKESAKIGAEKSKKKVLQYSLNNFFIKEYASATDAEHAIGIDNSSISKVCNGKRKYAGGFIWKWK